MNSDANLSSFSVQNQKGKFLPFAAFLLFVTAFVVTAQPVTNPANCHVYFLTPAASSWTEAEEYAVSVGGHLATVRSAEEHEWIMSTFMSGSHARRILWIGLSNPISGGRFRWASGEPVTFTQWHPGEPNNSTHCDPSGEHWVAMNWWYGNSGRRNDTSEAGEWNDTPVNGANWKCEEQPYFGLVEIAHQPPAITAEPADMLCNTNPVIFQVVAKGTAPLTYQWRRRSGSMNIWDNLANGPTGHGSTIINATTDTLSISNAQIGDVGQYDCLVANACNPEGVLSSAAKLIYVEPVAQPPPPVAKVQIPAKPPVKHSWWLHLLLTGLLVAILEMFFADLLKQYVKRDSTGALALPPIAILLVRMLVCFALFAAASGAALTLAKLLQNESMMVFARAFTYSNCLAAGILVIYYFIKEATAKPQQT